MTIDRAAAHPPDARSWHPGSAARSNIDHTCNLSTQAYSARPRMTRPHGAIIKRMTHAMRLFGHIIALADEYAAARRMGMLKYGCRLVKPEVSCAEDRPKTKFTRRRTVVAGSSELIYLLELACVIIDLRSGPSGSE